MNIFSKAPVISRQNPRGIVAEGVISDRETELTFNLAVESYGHLVPPSQYLTGAQWIEAINHTYDVSEPRHRAVVHVIKKVMLVDQFKDDHIVVSSQSSEPFFRGAAADGKAKYLGQWAGLELVPTRDVDAHMLRLADESSAINFLAEQFANGSHGRVGTIARQKSSADIEDDLASGRALSLSALGLPADVAYYPGAPDSLLVRVLDLLKIHPVGKPQFTATQQGDRTAGIALISVLCNLHGYGALVTNAKGITLKRPAQNKQQNMLSPVMIESSLMDFIESLEEAGWDGDSDLFVCRPAAAYNALMALRPYESLVHESMVGWRVPRGVVQLLADELNELKSQKEDVQRLGERAA